MSLLLHHTLIVPTSCTASTAAANYPATNVSTLRVLRPWRSTATSSQWLQVDLGAGVAVSSIVISDCNFSVASVMADMAATPTTNRGSLVLVPDKAGRRKGSLAFAATVRYIRITPLVPPADGAAFYSVGIALPFATVLASPRDPLYGGTGVDSVLPQLRTELTNGAVEVASAGPAYSEITLDFAAKGTDDVEELARRCRADVCWLDLGTSDRGLQWPVRHVEPRISRRMQRYNRESVTLPLREIV